MDILVKKIIVVTHYKVYNKKNKWSVYGSIMKRIVENERSKTNNYRTMSNPVEKMFKMNGTSFAFARIYSDDSIKLGPVLNRNSHLHILLQYILDF